MKTNNSITLGLLEIIVDNWPDPELVIASVQFSSVAQSCPTLCDPMNRSTPGLPVHHKLPEFTQTHVHRVSDAIQPSHPLSSPSPSAPSPSQHQSLFQWVCVIKPSSLLLTLCSEIRLPFDDITHFSRWLSS